VATDRAPGDLQLDPIQGEGHSLEEWLTMFHMAFVVIDPFTKESAWLLETAGKIMQTYRGSDCRMAWVCTGTEAQAKQFLGPWAKDILTFADPDREIVKAFGIEQIPAFLHFRQDQALVGSAEGWDPPAWRAVTEGLSKLMAWSKPLVPDVGDPAPFEGSPALL
jgi:hypothetical protein